jgi:tyrosinase
MVHSLVGNDYDQFGRLVGAGWMGDFATAGLDPVFWLHHSNIDRLWQVWLEADAGDTNPTGDRAWMRTKFNGC